MRNSLFIFLIGLLISLSSCRNDFEFEPSTIQMMADSGTSLNMIPDEDLEIIYGHFFKGKFEGCHKLHKSLYTCDCSVK